VDIHKPKPVHDWRGFVGEIGIIVIGVLIALSAEQIVDSLRWNERVQETRAQLKGEIADDAGSAIVWLSASPCLDQQLATLSEQVWVTRRTGVFAGVAQRFAPTLVMFKSDAWLNARSLQVSDHLRQKEVSQFSDFYFFPTELTGDVTTLHQEAAELQPLARPLDRVTPAEADGFLASIGRAQELQSRMELAAIFLIRRAEQLGAMTPLSNVQHTTARERQVYGACVADPNEVLKLLRSNASYDDVMTALHLAKPVRPQ